MRYVAASLVLYLGTVWAQVVVGQLVPKPQMGTVWAQVVAGQVVPKPQMGTVWAQVVVGQLVPKPQMGTVWAQVVYTALHHATTSGKCSIQCIHIATDASIQRSSLHMTHKTNVECNCECI